MYCLIHFGPDTYTDKEWGYGDEDPQIVNPSQFSAVQIVGAAKAGGFKGIVVVAKHHDGFCLWPTKTTEHNISKSPYKNGKGDLLQEYRDACNKLGPSMSPKFTGSNSKNYTPITARYLSPGLTGRMGATAITAVRARCGKLTGLRITAGRLPGVSRVNCSRALFCLAMSGRT
ncbi:MAG: hypothetical protein NVSMB24_25430 [Mucilaginibacter sp.]